MKVIESSKQTTARDEAPPRDLIFSTEKMEIFIIGSSEEFATKTTQINFFN